jgi:hypothetical protein
MKRVLHLIALLFISVNMFAQAPQKMSYQSVIRNASNALVVNAPVKMRISILQGSATGNAVYSELHSVTTNANGLVSIEIGAGSSPIGTFSSINWGNGTYFLKTETDPNNGTNYTIIGTSQLLSVPYALHANCVSSSISGDTLIVGCKKYVIPGIIDANVPPTLNNGLVGYWPFNGNANDESGNGNNGTVNGAILTTDRFGKNSNAYDFSNNGANIITPFVGPTGKNPRSISFWFYTNEINNSNDQWVMVNYGAASPYRQFTGSLWPTKSYVGVDINSSYTVYNTDVIGKWHNLTMMYDASFGISVANVKLYLDGVLLQNVIEQNGSFEINTGNTIPLRFGPNPGPFQTLQTFKGKLDDIRFYNRLLTQDEISWLANN